MRPKRCSVTLEELLDLEQGLADPAGAARLREHLAAGCEACDALRAEVGRTLAVLREGELTSAPDSVVARARDLFRERFVKPARRSFLAGLVFDSRDRLALSGARGLESGQLQALYSTEEHDIDLWQERGADGRWHLIGQVMPKEGGAPVAPEEATLLPEGGAPLDAAREGTELHFDAPAGRYALHITLPDAEIRADVEVGE